MEGKKGFLLGAAFSAVIFSALIILQQGVLVQQTSQASKPATNASQKFRAIGYYESIEGYFLLVDAAKDRSIWAGNGLDPEFVTIPGRRVLANDLKELVGDGIKIGISVQNEVLLARSQGVPIKIVAGYGGLGSVSVFVKADGPVKTVKDLDGKKIGVVSATDAVGRYAAYTSKRFSIKPEIVPLGNVTNNVVALKLGRIDAFASGEAAPLRLVDSGELRIVLRPDDVYPTPWTSYVVFATDDLIQQNPDLVKRFVRASLETAKYIKENPKSAAYLHIRRTNAPPDLADKAVALVGWQPSGRGSGLNLTLAVENGWQYAKDSGAIPANINVKVEDAVDVRFLP